MSSDQHILLWVLFYSQLCRRAAESEESLESIGLLLFPAANKLKKSECTRVSCSDSHIPKKRRKNPVLTCIETNLEFFFTLLDIDLKVVKIASAKSYLQKWGTSVCFVHYSAVCWQPHTAVQWHEVTVRSLGCSLTPSSSSVSSDSRQEQGRANYGLGTFRFLIRSANLEEIIIVKKLEKRCISFFFFR